MDTGLLTCPETDDRSVQCVGDAIRLGIFQRERGDDEVGKGRRRDLQDINI